MTGKDFYYHPTDKFNRKVKEVLNHKEMENRLTPATKCRVKCNVSEDKEIHR